MFPQNPLVAIVNCENSNESSKFLVNEIVIVIRLLLRTVRYTRLMRLVVIKKNIFWLRFFLFYFFYFLRFVNPLLPMRTNSSSKPDRIGYALLKVELF